MYGFWSLAARLWLACAALLESAASFSDVLSSRACKKRHAPVSLEKPRRWRGGIHEVDFVLSDNAHLVAIEVRGGRTKPQGGMAEFLERYLKAQRIVVGGSVTGARSVEDFLLGT